jgi:hypothetical protein
MLIHGNKEHKFKGTVQPDGIYMRVVPLEGLEKGFNRYRFMIFLFHS